MKAIAPRKRVSIGARVGSLTRTISMKNDPARIIDAGPLAMSQRHRHWRPAMVFGSKTVVPLIIVSRLFQVNRVRFRIRRIANGPQANTRSFSPTSFAVRIRARCCKITSISNATKTRKGNGSRLDGCAAIAARHLGSTRIHSTMQTANKIRAEVIIDPRLHDHEPSIGRGGV